MLNITSVLTVILAIGMVTLIMILVYLFIKRKHKYEDEIRHNLDIVDRRKHDGKP